MVKLMHKLKSDWLILAVMAIALTASLGCSALLGTGAEGLKDGVAGDPLQSPAQGGKSPLLYGLDFLIYLAAYVAGSLGKGKLRQMKAAAAEVMEEAVPDEK